MSASRSIRFREKGRPHLFGTRKLFEKGEKMKVFVYGTLLRGCGNHAVMEMSNGKFIKKDTINARMFTSNWSFPFISLNQPLDYKVHGEIYEVDNLHRLNRLEGYRGENDPSNLYDRRTITTDSGETAFVYEAGKYQQSRPSLWIINGDWKSAINKTEEEQEFVVRNCSFPLPKTDPQFWTNLLVHLKKNGGSVSIPYVSHRAMRYAAEKMNIKIKITLHKGITEETKFVKFTPPPYYIITLAPKIEFVRVIHADVRYAYRSGDGEMRETSLTLKFIAENYYEAVVAAMDWAKDRFKTIKDSYKESFISSLTLGAYFISRLPSSYGIGHAGAFFQWRYNLGTFEDWLRNKKDELDVPITLIEKQKVV
jgi:gamma-glutamylcyclotransferase (GGCT)/AIG2-like uncharacterized protein YtfP